jgi:hypothetical protein
MGFIREMIFPLFWPCVITLVVYVFFEHFVPYTEEVERLDVQCAAAGGIRLSPRNSEDICIKKEGLIEIK